MRDYDIITSMEVIEHTIHLTSHCFFIGIVFHYLTQLIDWSRFVKNPHENAQRLRIFIMLLSIALGFLISQFVWTLLMMSRDLFVAFS